MKNLSYRQVDVLAPRPLSGNGLAVFPEAFDLNAALMLRLAQELRQFESIFLMASTEPDVLTARVFTVEEELPFAGHPALGAGAVLHEMQTPSNDVATFALNFPAGKVRLNSQRIGHGSYRVAMEQGRPIFDRTLSKGEETQFLDALNLKSDHRDQSLPLQVVSTGLAYLIVPVTQEGLGRARVLAAGFENLLRDVGAKFVYVFDAESGEGRTWDNAGSVEDIATGSAAGPAGAYLVRHGVVQAGKELVLHQGRFVNRPSEIQVEVMGSTDSPYGVTVAGEVQMVGTGMIDGLVGAESA